MNIAVFCGASLGNNSGYANLAKELGTKLATQGHTLVYGGGHTGLMGVIADSALKAGGQVYGVIPDALVKKEVAHPGLTQLFVVKDMHQRKAKMAELAEGFVALPGGIGTLEEIFEVWTWSYLDYHQKPAIFLNVLGYYEQLFGFLAHTEQEGFVSAYSRGLVSLEDTVDEALLSLSKSHHSAM